MSDDRLSWHLWNWARWHRLDPSRLGYPRKASGGAQCYTNTDFDAMCNTADDACAEAVEAAINDLPMMEKVAIHHYHLYAVYRSREPIEPIYNRACDAVKKTLTRRGID